MTLSDLEELANRARNMPHLLVKIPGGVLTPEVSNSVAGDLQAQLNDQHIAEKLGRAFMLGRLHRFMGVKLSGQPPLDTIDECNLYAGGYQYDVGHDNPILDDLIEDEAEREAERVKQFDDLVAESARLVAEREAIVGTPPIELVERMALVRVGLQQLITANLISRLRVMEARMAENFGDLNSLSLNLDKIDDLLRKVRSP